MKPKEKYKLTPEHERQLKPWADKWIANAMSTKAITSDEKLDAVKYVHELYAAADLPKPTHVLFVPSPLALIVTGGFGVAITILGDKAKITIPEMVKRVVASCDIKNASKSRWYINGYDIAKLNKEFGFGKVGLDSVKDALGMWNGGNQWSGWASFISAFRYIAKLGIDYSKWNCYEKLAELTGPRIVHDFCILSDRPEVLTVNARNQPHNATGPFCKWRDGCAAYSVNGVRVPSFVVDSPETITLEMISAETNIEVRRVMIDQYGRDRYIIDTKAEVVHTDDFGTLYKKDLPGDEAIMMVKVVNSTMEPDGTYKDYWIRVDPKVYGGIKTAQAAVASTWRNPDGTLVFDKPEQYNPSIET